MNTKRKGTRNEHRSKRLFEKEGFRVTRAAASLGEWDLVCISSKLVVLCQVKTNRWPSGAEMEQMIAFPAPRKCLKLVHAWHDGERTPRVRVVRRKRRRRDKKHDA